MMIPLALPSLGQAIVMAPPSMIFEKEFWVMVRPFTAFTKIAVSWDAVRLLTEMSLKTFPVTLMLLIQPVPPSSDSAGPRKVSPVTVTLLALTLKEGQLTLEVPV